MNALSTLMTFSTRKLLVALPSAGEVLGRAALKRSPEAGAPF